MLVWKCVQVNLGKKFRKLERMIQGKMLNQAQESKEPTW